MTQDIFSSNDVTIILILNVPIYSSSNIYHVVYMYHVAGSNMC